VIALALAASLTMRAPLYTGYFPDYVVRISVGTQSGLVMIDTGSVITVLPPRVMERAVRLGQAVRVRTLEFELAGGGRIHMPIYRVRRFIIGRCALRNVYVAGAAGVPLLGLNVLRILSPWRITDREMIYTCHSYGPG
jgi:predicted aspartyl protease